ncbi:hypothetical protein ACLOJK_022229, partial [Asimina triloba]
RVELRAPRKRKCLPSSPWRESHFRFLPSRLPARAPQDLPPPFSGDGRLPPASRLPSGSSPFCLHSRLPPASFPPSPAPAPSSISLPEVPSLSLPSFSGFRSVQHLPPCAPFYACFPPSQAPAPSSVWAICHLRRPVFQRHLASHPSSGIFHPTSLLHSLATAPASVRLPALPSPCLPSFPGSGSIQCPPPCTPVSVSSLRPARRDCRTSAADPSKVKSFLTSSCDASDELELSLRNWDVLVYLAWPTHRRQAGGIVCHSEWISCLHLERNKISLDLAATGSARSLEDRRKGASTALNCQIFIFNQVLFKCVCGLLNHLTFFAFTKVTPNLTVIHASQIMMSRTECKQIKLLVSTTKIERLRLPSHSVLSSATRLKTLKTEAPTQSIAATSLNLDVPSELIPKIGMEFESLDEGYNFYNAYAWHCGFSVRKTARV